MKKTASSKNSMHRKTGKKTKQVFPPGWNERKVRAVIRHYDQLTDDELAQEIATAPEVSEETLISIPHQAIAGRPQTDRPALGECVVLNQPGKGPLPSEREALLPKPFDNERGYRFDNFLHGHRLLAD